MEKVHKALTDINCTASFIPGGCTGYLQVLDIALNKPLKDLVRDQAELHYDQNFEQWKNNSYSVGDRRILLTKWVAEAWKQLHIDNKDTIIRTFRKVGLTLNPDGFEDHELAIKDMGDIQIGYYSRDIIRCHSQGRSLCGHICGVDEG